MRFRPSWIAAASVLGLAAGRAWAQSVGEEFVPEEAMISHPSGQLTPLETIAGQVVIGLVFGAPIIPFIIGASLLARGNYEGAKMWSRAVIVLSGLHGFWALEIAWTTWTRSSTIGPDPWDSVLLASWSVTGIVAALQLTRTARERALNPPVLRAGARIRIREAPEVPETPVAP